VRREMDMRTSPAVYVWGTVVIAAVGGFFLLFR
jgi:hypothetical protein